MNKENIKQWFNGEAELQAPLNDVKDQFFNDYADKINNLLLHNGSDCLAIQSVNEGEISIDEDVETLLDESERLFDESSALYPRTDFDLFGCKIKDIVSYYDFTGSLATGVFELRNVNADFNLQPKSCNIKITGDLWFAPEPQSIAFVDDYHDGEVELNYDFIGESLNEWLTNDTFVNGLCDCLINDFGCAKEMAEYCIDELAEEFELDEDEDSFNLNLLKNTHDRKRFLECIASENEEELCEAISEASGVLFGKYCSKYTEELTKQLTTEHTSADLTSLFNNWLNE